MDDYKDIINMPYKKSEKHRMSLYARAAQFAPFAAVTGHEEAIEETARRTEDYRILDESMIDKINDTLKAIDSIIGEKPEVYIRYFNPDEKKEGGEYLVKKGRLIKNDTYLKKLKYEDLTEISYENIAEIEIINIKE